MFGFPTHSEDENVTVFTGNSGASSNTFTVWAKPPGIKFIRFFCMGAGGGAGRPLDSATSGTGGGGSGAISTVTYPSVFVPDTVFVQVGAGGIGGKTSGAAGGNGGTSYVVIYPDFTVSLVNRLVFATGGFGSGSPTTGGLAGTTTSISTCPLISNGIYFVRAGVAGFSGGAINGTNITTSSSINTPGAGGGYSGKGGDISSSGTDALYPFIAGTPSGTTTPAENGVQLFKPSRTTGGAGGTTASTGGNGSYGSGGGGTGPLGNGGDGGSGLVVISCW